MSKYLTPRFHEAVVVGPFGGGLGRGVLGAGAGVGAYAGADAGADAGAGAGAGCGKGDSVGGAAVVPERAGSGIRSPNRSRSHAVRILFFMAPRRFLRQTESDEATTRAI